MIDWGLAHGNLDDADSNPAGGTDKTQERLISTAAQILQAGQFLRFGVKVSSAGVANPFSQSSHNYDKLMYLIAKYGLKAVVNLHVGSSPYVVPASMTDWYNWIQGVATSYAPGGTFGNGSTPTVYGSPQTVSGWTPVTRYEIWNEPNGIGNPGDVGGMRASDAYNILRMGSKALRDHGFANSWTPYIIAFGMANAAGSNIGMQAYWKSIVDYGNASGTSYTVNSVVYGPNPHDFCDAVGIHPYSSADPAAASGGGNPIQTIIGDMRTYVNANGGSIKDFYLTEWGWRGHNLSNRYNGGASNVEWEGIADQGAGQASQELWEMAGMDMLLSQTAWKIKGAHHYQMTDDNGGGSTQNLGITYDPSAASSPGPIAAINYKAVATAMKAKLAAYAAGSSPPSSTIVPVLRRGLKIKIAR